MDGTPTTSAGNNAVHSSLSTAVAPAPAAPVPAPAFSAPAPTAPAAVGSAQGVHHGIKFDYSFQKDAYADFAYTNDVGYLPDGTPMNRAGNAINHPEMIQPDPHTPGSPLPRALFVNSVGYLPDGTPMNMAGNAVNHPETIQPDLHTPGAALPASAYSADVGYLVDGTSLDAAGNNSLKPGMTASQMSASSAPAPVVSAPTTAAPASAGSAQGVHHGIKFDYSFQKDAYADFAYTNDVGYLPDGTPMNRAGNAINHPEMIQPDPHTPGSPLPRALFVNSVGYLPDGTPMNMAGNAVNHPETIQPDLHTPGAALPASAYSADVGYLVDGTSLDAAGNNSLKPGMTASQMPASSAPAPVVSAPTTAAPASAGSAQGVHHGIKFDYSFQKDAYADFAYTNDVGYLPDGTPMNRAGNAINHPEMIQPDPHTPGSPLPRALFVNSVGYLPDGTPMNMAGNAINHPETIQPDLHSPGAALPASAYSADVGYLVDGTSLDAAGNNSLKPGMTASQMPASSTPASPVSAAVATPVAAAFVGSAQGMHHGIKFDYSFQKDAYADFAYTNDVGYLPDGTPMNRAGNAINHPEMIQPDPHTPGSPLPRALFVNSVGYLPDGTPMNMAGNAINHPETIQPDVHAPGAALPTSAYSADVGYLVDGTPLHAAGNNSLKAGTALRAAIPTVPPSLTASSSQAAAASFVGSTRARASAAGFLYSAQRSAHADFLFTNDVGYLPDGTPLNKAQATNGRPIPPLKGHQGGCVNNSEGPSLSTRKVGPPLSF